MPKASSEQMERVLEILSNSFRNNPSVDSVINSQRDKLNQIDVLVNYAYWKARNRDGVFISEDERGVALCFKSDQQRINLKELVAELSFARAISFKKAIQAVKREKEIKRKRISDPHLYFWFFGAEPGGNDARELKNEIFRWSEKSKLPILAETSVSRNKEIYQRFGFKVYDEYIDQNGTLLWFMCRYPNLDEDQ